MTLRQYRERVYFWASPKCFVSVKYRGLRLSSYVDLGCWLRILDDYSEVCSARSVMHGLTAKQAYSRAWNACLRANGKGGRK